MRSWGGRLRARAHRGWQARFRSRSSPRRLGENFSRHPLRYRTQSCRPYGLPLHQTSSGGTSSHFRRSTPSPDAIFAIVPMPLEARIDGRGVGAMRHCMFTNGVFDEPIAVWREGRELTFGVALGPSGIGGYLDVTRGQFPPERRTRTARPRCAAQRGTGLRSLPLRGSGPGGRKPFCTRVTCGCSTTAARFESIPNALRSRNNRHSHRG